MTQSQAEIISSSLEAYYLILHTADTWLQASSLSRGLPTLWSHMCIINDALCIIYDTQWCTVQLWQFWSFGRFFKRQEYNLEDFFVSFYYMNDAQWRTVHHCVSFMMDCASLMMHSALLCNHTVGSPLNIEDACSQADTLCVPSDRCAYDGNWFQAVQR